MIIPISEQNINIGDIVINIKIIDYIYYTISIGHEFIVKEYNKNYNYYICEDLNEHIKVKLHKHEITKKVDFKTAEKEHINKIEINEYKKIIRNYCPNADYDYDYEDRDKYESCMLIKNGYNYCKPKLKCTKYLSQEDINKSTVLLKHLRLNKIDKINKS